MSESHDTTTLDDEIMARMLAEFQKEARDHLDHLNLFLIQLEEDPKDEKLINRIFRVAHTIKGSAGFAGLTEISEVARRMEELLGEARKGNIAITEAVSDALFEGIDVLTEMLDAAEEGRPHTVSTAQYMARLGELMGGDGAAPAKEEDVLENLPEIASFYKEAYDQLAALKHLVYSSTHLTDEESLAVLFSRQIAERMAPEKNSVWLVEHGRKVTEIARNGKLVKPAERRILDIESSEVLRRVINEQLAVWPTSLPTKDILPDYDSPTLFPLKAQAQAYGFLGLDPEEATEMDSFQFVGQFAAMMMNISKLHRQVAEQKQELDELTQILFKQNTQLSSLYHIELELMAAATAVELCGILTSSLVNDLFVRRAMALVIDDQRAEISFAASEGFERDHLDLAYPLEGDHPLQQSLQSGRIVSSVDLRAPLDLGGEVLEEWVVLCLKGRERVQGMLVVEPDDDDITDSISILTNYSGILLDNLRLLEDRAD